MANIIISNAVLSALCVVLSVILWKDLKWLIKNIGY
jgi:hypothetical protein